MSILTLVKAETPETLQEIYPLLVDIYPNLSQQDFISRATKRTDYVAMRLFKVMDKAALVGAVSFARFHNMIHGDVLYLEEIVVKPELRNQGYGRMIFDLVVQFAKAEACSVIYTDDSSPLGDRSGFFARLGGQKVSNLYEFKVAA